jgi:hypothetical protein
MPTPLTAPPEPRSAEQIREAVLARLRQGTNPFAFSVATAGTEENCDDLALAVPPTGKSRRSCRRFDDDCSKWARALA